MTDDDKKRSPKETDSYELSLDDTIASAPATGIDSLFEDALEAVEKRRTKGGEEQASEPEAADENPEAGTPEPKAADKVDQELADEVEKLRGRLVRTMADFDNFRKRTDREKTDLRKQAAGSVLRDFLEVVDNLERALSASGKLDELKQGVEMILKQQVDILRRHGVERVESVGQPFDPNVHEAVAREEGGPDLDGPTVMSEMQAGYRHHDRLLRPAMVTVAVPPAKRTKDVREALDEEEPDFDFDGEHTIIGIDA